MHTFICRIIPCTLLALSLFGCASAGRTPEPEIPAADALSTLDQATHTSPNAVRITSKIDYVDEINNKRVVGQDLILSAQAPGSMRITISAFDKAISTLVTDGTGFSLIDVTQNVYVTGHATPDNIARILPVYLSGMDLYRVIFGDYPKDGLSTDALRTQEFLWDSEKGGYRRSLMLSNGFREEIYYAWPSGDIFLIRVMNGSKTVYAYEASDFRTYTADGNSFRYPQTIMFSLPEHKTDVRLRVEKRDLDVEFSEAVFRLLPPAGARIIVLDDNAQNADVPGISDEQSQPAQTEQVQDNGDPAPVQTADPDETVSPENSTKSEQSDKPADS